MTETDQGGGEITLARRGVAALTALKQAEQDGEPTPEQRAAMRAWPGWGPLAKAFNWARDETWTKIGAQLHELATSDEWETARNAVDTAFFTPPLVADAVWGIVTGLGFTGGRVLEPGCGSGRFISAAPAGLQVEWTGVESDQTTARIAQLVHPQARIIHGRLEKTPLRVGSFDATVGNVPFAKEGPYDPNTPKDVDLSLHNYFIWRALTATRPGGLVVLVTSRYTLDAANPVQREELARLGAFLGAIRLPGAALAPGGTHAVTDIIAFRRHVTERDYDADERWSLNAAAPEGLQTPVNTYFRANPGMVLGELRDRAGLRYGMTLDVAMPAGADLAGLLGDAVTALVKDARSIGLTWCPMSGPAAEDDAPLGDPAREGAFTLHPDGAVTRQRDGRHEPAKAGQELLALIRLRDAAIALFTAEADQGMTGFDRGRVRDHARGLYQAYVARFGPLNRCDLSSRQDPDGEPGQMVITRRRPAMGGFRTDPDYVTVLALEVWDDDTQTASPAPVLLRHVNAPAARKQHTEDPGEALLLALDEAGRVDLDVIARILQTSPESVPGILAGRIWQDPESREWATGDEYLSGNVRGKLAAAKRAAERDPGRWQGHVDALQQVQPADLGPEDINAQLGSPWIPPAVIQQFTADVVCSGRSWLHRQVTVRYAPLTAQWEVRASTEVRSLPAASNDWGTLRVNAINLIEHALNGTTPTVWEEDTNGDRFRNNAETALAADKIRDLQERFAEWLWEDPARADDMARAYNDRFNCTRVRRYDGSLLTFPGMAGGFTPYPSQRDMVWRAVCTPAALCGHTVGAGKTSIMVLTAMTLRRLGLANKPAMIVPNHLLEQETAEARRLYPGARILMVTREDLTAERRRYFAAKVAARDWDLILMTHQQFMALPVSAQVQADYLAGVIEELDAALGDDALERTKTAKQLAGRRKKLLAQHEELLHAPRDAGLTFEMTGIDYLMVDEGHLFKNLAMSCRAEGFGTGGSKRADDLMMKLGWLREKNADGRCGALFTGTPISNSLAELHVLFRYLAPGRLADLDLQSFDAFAGQYIRYATQTEVAPDGSGFRSARRPVRYANLPELRAMLGEVADIRTRADLELAGPEVTVEHAAIPPDPQLTAYTATLVERADKIRSGGVDVRVDNMLAICGDGRRAALDLRLAGIEPDGPGKLEDAAARIAAEYHATRNLLYPDPTGEQLVDDRPGGFQLVFCDQGTPNSDGDQVYGRLADHLAGLGVPRGKVAFIHAAKSHGDRAALFARCRSGEIAVLIGSTEKCGTGVNIQHRMTAIHHLDAPWRPADVEQRDGRGDRPKNGNPRLRVTRYVTEKSFDAYMWQALERKARFIAQILTGSLDVREVEDGGNPQLLSYGELKALATGQPLLMELSRVNSEIARLRNQHSGHKRTQSRMYQDWQQARHLAGEHGEYADELDAIAHAAAGAGDDRALTRDHRQWPDENQTIEQELQARAVAARDRRHKVDAGTYRGIQVKFECAFSMTAAPKLVVELAAHYWTRHPHTFTSRGHTWAKGGGRGLLAELDAAIDAAAGLAGRQRELKASQEARVTDLEPYLNQEWPHKAKVAALVAERVRIEREIDAQVKTEPGREEAKAA